MRETLDRVSDILTGTRWFGALALIVPILVMLFRSCVGTFPNASIVQHVVIGRDFPGQAGIPANATYLYNSMTSAITAHFLGINTVRSWLIMSALLLIVAIVVIALMAAHAVDRSAIGLVLAVFAAAGVSTIMLGWVGSYDVYTLMAFTVIALSRKWWLTLIGGFIAGTNWFEMSIVAVIALTVLGWADGKDRAIRAGVALGGIVLGRLAVAWWQASSGASGSRADYVSHLNLVEGFWSSVRAMPTLAFTWMAAATLLVAWMFLRRIVPRWRLVCALAVALAPAMIAEDQTRVGALAVWPLLAWLTIEAYRHEPVGTKRAVSMTLLVACIFPAVVFWEGNVYMLNWWLAPITP